MKSPNKLSPKISDPDSSSIYYDAFEYLTADKTTRATMDANKVITTAPLTTTPVRPIIGDQVVVDEIQEKRRASKGDDDRSSKGRRKTYELVDVGPVPGCSRHNDQIYSTSDGSADDEREEDYPEKHAVQQPNESAGWLPAVDTPLPKKSKSVGQTRGSRRYATSSGKRRADAYDAEGVPTNERHWGEPSGSNAKRSASTASRKTAGTMDTFTTDDGRVVRASAFLPNGAGTVGTGSLGIGENKKTEGKRFGWGLGFGRKDQIEKDLEKVVKAEGKTEKRALRDAVKELEGLTKVQKEAVKNESQAQTKLTSLLSDLHKSKLAYMHTKREYETTLAAMHAQEEIVVKVREGAREATEMVREKAVEVSELRLVLERDDSERAKP